MGGPSHVDTTCISLGARSENFWSLGNTLISRLFKNVPHKMHTRAHIFVIGSLLLSLGVLLMALHACIAFSKLSGDTFFFMIVDDKLLWWQDRVFAQ